MTTTPLRNTTPKQNAMSTSLKERLKRLGRYHRSPEETAPPLMHDKSNFTNCLKNKTYENTVKDSAKLSPEFAISASRKRSASPTTSSTAQTIEAQTAKKRTCESMTTTRSTSSSDAENVTEEQLEIKLQALKHVVAVKEESVRKLRLVKMYRVKNDLDSLDDLIQKWTKTCQQALIELHENMPPPAPTMNELLAHLQIEAQMVAYDTEQEEFHE